MYGRILKILEHTHKVSTTDCDKYYSGYMVVTSSHTIFLGIDDNDKCCEKFGYITTLDNLDDFYQAEVVDVTFTDVALDVDSVINKIRDEDRVTLYIHDCAFVTVKTSNGEFQLVVYNQHNGYYGHDVVFMIDDKIAKTDYL